MNRLRELIAKIRLMQSVGKYRIGFLALFVFTLLLLVGIMICKMSIWWIILSLIVAILHGIGVLIWTLK